jgi:hypothetical protein
LTFASEGPHVVRADESYFGGHPWVQSDLVDLKLFFTIRPSAEEDWLTWFSSTSPSGAAAGPRIVCLHLRDALSP